MLTLDALNVGRIARIKNIAIGGNRGTQLMEMGLTPGTNVAVSCVAPFGGVIDVLVRGYHLSLRRSEAKHIQITS